MATKLSVSQVVGVGVALIIVALIMPTAIANIISGATLLSDNSVDPAVITVFGTLLPIVAVIAIMMYFIPKMRSS